MSEHESPGDEHVTDDGDDVVDETEPLEHDGEGDDAQEPGDETDSSDEDDVSESSDEDDDDDEIKRLEKIVAAGQADLTKAREKRRWIKRNHNRVNAAILTALEQDASLAARIKHLRPQVEATLWENRDRKETKPSSAA